MIATLLFHAFLVVGVAAIFLYCIGETLGWHNLEDRDGR